MATRRKTVEVAESHSATLLDRRRSLIPPREKSMRNSFGLRWLATLGLVLVPATAMSSGPFDGSWSVVVACAQAPDGAKAYRWNFTAQVRDGSFLGQYNQPGNIPSGTLSGQIQPTGNAHLTMDGLTGDPDYSLSRVHAGTPRGALCRGGADA